MHGLKKVLRGVENVFFSYKAHRCGGVKQQVGRHAALVPRQRGVGGGQVRGGRPKDDQVWQLLQRVLEVLVAHLQARGTPHLPAGRIACEKIQSGNTLSLKDSVFPQCVRTVDGAYTETYHWGAPNDDAHGGGGPLDGSPDAAQLRICAAVGVARAHHPLRHLWDGGRMWSAARLWLVGGKFVFAGRRQSCSTVWSLPGHQMFWRPDPSAQCPPPGRCSRSQAPGMGQLPGWRQGTRRRSRQQSRAAQQQFELHS